MRIYLDFKGLAAALITGSLSSEEMAPQGIQYRQGKDWSNVTFAITATEKDAANHDEHVYLLGERLRYIVRTSLALTPAVIKKEAIELKESIRLVAKNSKAHRAMARRIQLLAQAIPQTSDNLDHQAAQLALDIAATRENITLNFKEVA